MHVPRNTCVCAGSSAVTYLPPRLEAQERQNVLRQTLWRIVYTSSDKAMKTFNFLTDKMGWFSPKTCKSRQHECISSRSTKANGCYFPPWELENLGQGTTVGVSWLKFRRFRGSCKHISGQHKIEHTEGIKAIFTCASKILPRWGFCLMFGIQKAACPLSWSHAEWSTAFMPNTGGDPTHTIKNNKAQEGALIPLSYHHFQHFPYQHNLTLTEA